MVSVRTLLLGIASLTAATVARSVTGDRVLVVLDSDIEKGDYSNFWSSLESRGYDLTFKGPKDDTAQLSKYGEAQYDHLILYAPTAKTFSKHLSPKAIIDAQLSGLNTLYLLSSSLSEVSRETLREYDLEFSETGSLLLDAFSHPASSSPSSVLLPPTTCLIPNGPLLSNSTLTGGPILYPSGAVHTVGQNPYLIEVAHAPPTAHVGVEADLSADEAQVEATVGGKTGKGPILAGRKAGLVSALQTRDNVRIGFVGSGAMFSDKYWGKKVKTAEGSSLESGNAGLAEDFTKWIFQETGVVKVVSTHHHRDTESESRDAYTKKDPVTYTITLAQYTSTPTGGSWGPVSLPDLQLDFTMLDPHIRTALKEVSSSATGTTYTASFRAPDRHGVFKFVVEYWRPGWTYIRSADKASVVPLRHDEHPRWISGAWPFYSSTISISVAFLLFCSLWVMVGEGDSKGKKKAE